MGECELERQSVEEGLPEREPLGDFEGLPLAELDPHSEGLPELVIDTVELKHGDGLPEKVEECELEMQPVIEGLPERVPLGDNEGLLLNELEPLNEGLTELELDTVELKNGDRLLE